MDLASNLQNARFRETVTCQGSQSGHGGWVQYGTVGEIPAEGCLCIDFVYVLTARSATACEDQFQFAGGYDQMVGNN